MARPFFAYILLCVDKSYYVGHTDDLENRLASHRQGVIPGYTVTRQPVTLVWSQQFPTGEEALAAERRLKTGAGQEGSANSRGFLKPRAIGKEEGLGRLPKAKAALITARRPRPPIRPSFCERLLGSNGGLSGNPHEDTRSPRVAAIGGVSRGAPHAIACVCKHISLTA